MAVIASYAPVNATQIGGVAVSGTPAVNQEIVATGASAAAWAPSLVRQAATPLAGTALVNGTPTILTWTAPNDGQNHRATLFGSLTVTLAETGGIIQFSWTPPGGSLQFNQVFAGGAGAGTSPVFPEAVIVAPNSAVSVIQGSALTAGAATLWAEIWAS